jgi:DnaJ homolog subfamily C member 11
VLILQAKGSITLGIDATSMLTPSENGDFVYLRLPALRPTSYSVGYSFKTPLPAFRSFWSSIDEQTEAYSEAKTTLENGQFASEGSEVTFSATVAGKLRTPTRQIELMYEDGSKEIQDVLCAYNRWLQRLLICLSFLCHRY